MSETHRDLLFCSRSRCLAWKNHRWGLGPTETSNSGLKVAVLHAENDRCGVVPIQTCNLGAEGAVLHEKTTDEGWDP